jgi:hypothetical protein
MRILALTAAVAALALGSAAQASVTIPFNTSGYWGSFTLDVTGGQATDGTGVIHIAGQTLDMTLITPSTPGDINDSPAFGPVGFQNNNGDDLFGADTSLPLDFDGLLFYVGAGAPVYGTGDLLNLWANGDGTYGAVFYGRLNPADPGSELYGNPPGDNGVAVIPEPATWAMMLTGMFGLGAVLRAARRRVRTVVA